MSMFHELMMRKKEQIMYATIKGSPTESPSGVFSGFSSSNYLQLQDDITEIPTDFEIQTRISIPATNSGFAIHFLSYSGNSSGIRVFSSGKLNFYSKNNDNNAVEIIGTTVLSLDTFYFIKIKKVGNTITLYSSTDNITWTTEGTTTTTSTIPLTSKIGFGHCGNANNNNYIFNGSIDLNRSYIKLGSTKYNFQAVVGYTIVGSPTITDGVVSGFSSGNYLTLNKALTVTNTMDIEIYVRAKMPSTISSGFNFVYSNTSGYPTYFFLGTYTSAVFTARMALQNGVGLKFDDLYISVQTDTWYRFKITGKDGIWKLEIFDDNGNLLKTDTKDWSSSSVNADYTFKFQCIDNTNTYSGSIDMNETYIKKDRKLWFNGQQS